MLSVDDNDQPSTHRTEPPPAVVVFLRGPGAGKSTWSALTAAAVDRGWIATRDRTQAWHLCRGGLPTVMLDFPDVDLDQPGAVTITAGRVQAKYELTPTPTTAGRLLTPADRQRLAGEGWLTTPVTTETRTTVLPLRGERVTVQLRPEQGGLDFGQLAHTVSELAG